MQVSAILTATGFLVSAIPSNQPVQAETYLSFRVRNRDGEGRYAGTSANAWNLGLRTGRRETFRHVMGATQGADHRWTARVANMDEPIRIETSLNYFQNNTWIHNRTRDNLSAGFTVIEHHW